MKAARIHAYGGPETLVYEDAPDPVAGAGELLVAVEASGVNPADYKFRRGDYAAHYEKAMPLVLGMDVAGKVLAVGAGAEGFAPGDAVFGMIPHTHKGGYAEKIAAPAAFFAHRPADLDAVTAAALPTPATTGIELVQDDLGVKAGQRVLVSGATGAVGRAAAYTAKRLGAHVTVAVRARRQGEVPSQADAVLITDDPAAAAPEPFDVIADTIGGSVANGLAKHLKPGGTLCSVATDPIGDTGRSDVTVRRFACTPSPDRLSDFGAAVASGEVAMPPVTTLPLSQASEAHRLIEQGGVGKYVLKPGG